MDVRTNIIQTASKQIDEMTLDQVLEILPPMGESKYTAEEIRQWAFDILADQMLRDYADHVRDMYLPENNEHTEYK